MSERSILAVEVCVRADATPGLVDRLRQRIYEHPSTATRGQKWEFYRACADDICANLGSMERGCWDFFDEDTRARRDYTMWFEGMTTEEGARLEPSIAAGGPYRGEPRYLTFTMAFLIVNGTPSERAIASLCEVPQEQLWLRGTFARILRGMSTLSFASVESDVVYLIPRDANWALTAQDLTDPKFEYLRALSD